MKKLAWSAFVAFWSAVLSLLAVFALLPDSQKSSPHISEKSSDAAYNPNAHSQPRRISPEELAQHNTENDCWKAIHGKVYDVTEMIHMHPTPPITLIEWCGKDATKAYADKGDGVPHSAVADMMLEDYLIGVLETDE